VNDQSVVASLQSRGFRAWQARFIASFLEADAAPFQLLAAPTGTGKMHASTEIAAETAARGAHRILVLAPAPICEAWQRRLDSAQSHLPVVLVTRQTFREMVAAVPIGQSPWTAGGIFVISQDLAKQSDLAAGLSMVTWHLVIVDEAHRLVARQRTALLDRLMVAGVVQRLLLLSATPLPALEQWLRPPPDQPATFPKPLAITSWFGALKNWDGSEVERPGIRWKVVAYTRGADEVQFLSRFMGLLPELEKAYGGNRFLIHLLTQRAASSRFAIEQSLQRLRSTLRRAIEGTGAVLGESSEAQTEPDLDAEEDELVELTTPENASQGADKSAVLAAVEYCLEALDGVSTDEKLNALRRLIRLILETQPGLMPKICIYSIYADTAVYLDAAVEELGISSCKVTGTTPFADRQAVIERFLERGGLLIGTDAGLSVGTDLLAVTHVIHYDLPSNPAVLEQRRGQFERYGRDAPCTMYVLRDESGVMPRDSRLIDTVTSSQNTNSIHSA
jgi:superfamily II DNA or RNA helicase